MTSLASVIISGGILQERADVVLRESGRTGLPLAVSCVMLMKETGGGHNIYGHDRGTCFSRPGTHYVTRENYQEYLACVRGGGKRNGVGPTQLTWWEFQEEADRRGGCWNPDINIAVGFEVLARNVRSKGVWGAFKAYNGAAAYADASMLMLPRWEKIVASAGGGSGSQLPTLREGDRDPGPDGPVRRLQRELSEVYP